jgi:hypothetical protein
MAKNRGGGLKKQRLNLFVSAFFEENYNKILLKTIGFLSVTLGKIPLL